jgi:archaemetzincin
VIHLVQVGPAPDRVVLARLGSSLASTFRTECDISPWQLDPAFAYDSKRNQYYSTAILKMLTTRNERVLGITMVDLFVPVLTFVFGEAQLGGTTAIVSVCRLRQEFYGLPPSDDVFFERLVKESVHELGHTHGLRHCDAWECAMSSSHGVEKIDLKSAEFCGKCGSIARLKK